MSDAPRYSNLRDYLRVLRQHRVLITLCVFLFAGAAALYSARQDTEYEAETSVALRDPSADSGNIGSLAPIQDTPEGRAAKVAQEVTTLSMAEEARRRLRTTASATRLLDAVETNVEARTNFVVVTAKARSAQTATNVSLAFAEATKDLVTTRQRDEYRRAARTLRAQNRDLRGGPGTGSRYARDNNIGQINRLESLAKVVQPASIAVRPVASELDPVAPRPLRNTIVGVLLGLTIGLVLAFLRSSLDRRFRRTDEVREELGLPLLGQVRDESLGRSVTGGERPALDESDLEAFRILRANLDFLDIDNPVKTLAVTSALPEEGKSTVTMALAYAYASAGKRVLVLECDLRRPTFAQRLGLNAKPGLTDYLGGHAEPADVLQTVSVEAPSVNGGGPPPPTQIVCITAGTQHPQPFSLLSSQRFASFLKEVREAYDTVLIDTSPLLAVGDTLEIVPQVDGLVLCVRTSRTTRDQARAAKAALSHLPDRPTGVVVTGVRAGEEGDYGYYAYAYGAEAKA
ncbi:polysaccharide biosynthesis tyrosine autokinase [Conexibacter sp. SYSU D00693]|uniref:polysaccharide biosynthesis tyrosine autokinase n=1 Tax=Conexibacter sp. SYSU D00693 TaxID=2812560 RepID=UPI002111E328|nr:polysaccharide biosynthesis tyrosine autokinase [Conexibacter sp. SYSU D00693]